MSGYNSIKPTEGLEALVYKVLYDAIIKWLNPKTPAPDRAEARRFIDSTAFCDYWTMIFESDPEPVQEKLLSGTVDYNEFRRLMYTKEDKEDVR